MRTNWLHNTYHHNKARASTHKILWYVLCQQASMHIKGGSYFAPPTLPGQVTLVFRSLWAKQDEALKFAITFSLLSFHDLLPWSAAMFSIRLRLPGLQEDKLQPSAWHTVSGTIPILSDTGDAIRSFIFLVIHVHTRHPSFMPGGTSSQSFHEYILAMRIVPKKDQRLRGQPSFWSCAAKTKQKERVLRSCWIRRRLATCSPPCITKRTKNECPTCRCSFCLHNYHCKKR